MTAQWWRVALYAALFLFLVFLHLSLAAYAADDAYIHFRIARNFLRFGAPYYNHHEAVMASSSSLWTVLLTLSLAVFSDPLLTTPLINAAISLANVLVWSAILRRGGARSLIVADSLAALLYGATTLVASIQLMETPLALALLGMAVLGLVDGRSWAALPLACAVFCRLEVLVFVPCSAVYVLLRRAREVRRFVIYALLGTLPFIAYGYFYFGTVIPQTVVAKRVIYSLRVSEVLVLALKEWVGEVLLFRYPALVAGWLVVTVGVILFALARLARSSSATPASDGTVAAGDPGRSLAPYTVLLLVPSALLFLAYCLSRTFLFPWYTPLYALPLLTYCVISARMRGREALVLCVILLAPALPKLGLNIVAPFGRPDLFAEFTNGATVRRYLSIGHHIQANQPNATVMAPEIGGLGYAFEGILFDSAGLATPDALRHYSTEQTSTGMLGTVPPTFVAEKMPDFIVAPKTFATSFLSHPVSSSYLQEEFPVFLPVDLARSSEHLFVRGGSVYLFRQKALP